MNTVSGIAHGDIVAGLTNGDEDVLGKLAAEFGLAIRRRLTKKFRGVLTSEDIEDLVWIAFERAWCRHDRFDPRRGSLSGWLCTIADHAAVDLVRSPSFRARLHECHVSPTRLAQLVDPRSSHPPNTEPPDTEPPDTEPPGTEPPGTEPPDTERPREIAAIRSALDRLPEAEREVLLADATAADVVASSASLARRLGITSSAVRSRRQRGLARLRRFVRTALLPKPPVMRAPDGDRDP